MERFQWHPAARLMGGGPEPAGPAVLDARPAPRALAQAVARAALGLPFRIGAPKAPAPLGEAMFETLTSGSSGTPRRIRRSQTSWLASFAVNGARFGIGPGVGVATLGRLDQSLSLYAGVEGLHLGATLHLLDGMRPDRQRQALASDAVAVLYATPAQLRLMVEAGGPPCPALRWIVVGGSKLDAALRAGLNALAPAARVAEFYGAAEASFITMADAQTPPASVGRAYPGVQIEVRDGGAVWVRSPYLFQGYAGADPGGARWQDGWLTVGEMGRIEDGWLYLSGRAGRMVTVADQNVFPEEIEDFLLTLPGVARAAVLPRPDAARGVVLVAMLRGDAGQAEAIMAALRARLGPLCAPRSLVWVQDWPVLPSGKTDLAALQRGLE